MPIPVVAAAPSRRALTDIVFDRLVAIIESGDLIPGEVIDERELEEWSGASRTPVREAIDRLAEIGLMEVRPQRATRVAADDPVRARESLEFLGAVLGPCLELVLPVLDQEERDGLRLRMPADPADLLKPAGAVAELVRLTGNDRIDRIWRELTPYVRRHWALNSSTFPAAATTAADRLSFALARGNAAAAGAALQDWCEAAAPERKVD